MLARINFVAGVAVAFVAALALSSVSLTAHADDATIAVAANFAAPAEALQKLFEQRTPHHLKFTSGSTGQLYAQIANGAPLDALLSADREHVDQLITAGLADGTLRFTYAIGKLALWTRETDKFKPLDLKSLERGDYRWLAIANPELAPYGLAAEQALRKLGLWDSLQSRHRARREHRADVRIGRDAQRRSRVRRAVAGDRVQGSERGRIRSRCRKSSTSRSIRTRRCSSARAATPPRAASSSSCASRTRCA